MELQGRITWISTNRTNSYLRIDGILRISIHDNLGDKKRQILTPQVTQSLVDSVYIWVDFW